MPTDQDNPRVFIPPPLIFATLLGLGLWVDGQPIAIGPVQATGVAVTLAGLGLIFTALGLFRSRGTRPEPWQPANTLVGDGLYRVTRNPMYLGMALLALGVALILRSIAGSALTAIALIVIDRAVVPREEAYLLRRFGTAYADYRQRVRRWL